MSHIPTFGVLLPDIVYVSRPGAYAVFFNTQGELGLVRTGAGRYFLAGGGMEPGETPETTVLREVLEETGLSAEILRPLGVAVEYFLDEISGIYYQKKGYFYLLTILGLAPGGKIEDDHHLLWMPPAKAAPLLYHDMFRWALEQAGGGTISSQVALTH